jgi:uncharacterized membrane protein (DUF373 family)
MNLFKKTVDVLIKLMIPFTNILSLFIIMELLRSLIVYFESHRLKITFIIDGALVFILWEIMIGLYQSKMATREILSLSGY